MRKAEESKSDSRAQHPYTLATAPLRTAEESLCRPSLGAPVSGLQGLCSQEQQVLPTLKF